MEAVNHLPGGELHLVDTKEPRYHHTPHVLTDLQRTGQTVAPFFRVMDKVLRDRLIRHNV